MPPRQVDPQELRAAVTGVLDALAVGMEPAAGQLAAAVRLSLSTLARTAPGRSVEVRVPPYGAIQCGEGPRHTRGQPPNTVETDPISWVRLAAGELDWAAAREAGLLQASGNRSNLSRHLPLVRV